MIKCKCGEPIKWFRLLHKGTMRKIAVNAKPARRIVPFPDSTQVRVLDVFKVHVCGKKHLDK